MNQKTIDVVLYREGAYWVAQAVAVDVSSFGETQEAARAAIREALELYFEDESAPCRDAREARLEQVVV